MWLPGPQFAPMADEKPKKLSLKEIAERAAKTQPQLNPAPTRVTYAPGEGLGSSPPASRPPLSQPPGSGAPTSVPPTSQPPASGAPTSVPPASKPPASAPPPAKPSDKPEAAEKKTESAKPSKAAGAAAKAAPAKPAEDNKGGSPLPLLLGGIVLVSIAAVAYAMVNRPQGPTATPMGMAGAAASVAEAPSAAPSASVAVAPPASASADPSGAMDIDSLGAVAAPTPADTGKAAHGTGAAGTAAKDPDPKKGDTPAVASAAPAASIGPAGELSDEIKKRMGGGGAAGKTDGDTASGGPPTDAKESRPSAGAVAGALNAVRNAARACLADTEDVAKVSLVFGSSGAVQSASVSGAGKAEGCVKAAIMKAKVAPFTDPTYSTSVTIRP